MDGKAIRLVQYLEGSDKRFIFPVYQRNYSRKKDNCRQQNIKASFISYALNGVSIINETDWIRMAKFHAELSKKLCDVLLPYLKDLYPGIKL